MKTTRILSANQKRDVLFRLELLQLELKQTEASETDLLYVDNQLKAIYDTIWPQMYADEGNIAYSIR